ncbi:MAG: rhodanese-like domain-containing protein [Rhodomicrobium sp.]
MNVKSVNPATLKSWLDAGEAMVIDVREHREYAIEHLEGSTLIPLSSLHPAALPDHNGQKLVMLCRSGNRSMFACMKLGGSVSAEIYNLDGGILGWKKQGFPVRQPGQSSRPEDGVPLAAKLMRFMTRFS